MAVFTFIIPHYNVPELLVRCLASIPEREDVQVLVIDDGSPDIDSYPDLYPKLFRNGVTWIRGDHGGAGHARNLGLQKADGKWLLFADSDDFYTEELSDFLDENADASEDIIFFRNKCVLSEHPEREARRDQWLDAVFERYAVSGNPDELRFTHCTPWGKMIRRSVVEAHRIRFDELPYCNDMYFSVLVGSKVSSVRVDNRCLYVLTQREGSLTANFGRKPGELELRTNVAIRAQKVMNACGYRSPYPPVPRLMSMMIHSDRPLYRRFLRRIPEVYDSYWTALKELAGREKGMLNKVKLYTYSLFALLAPVPKDS